MKISTATSESCGGEKPVSLAHYTQDKLEVLCDKIGQRTI